MSSILSPENIGKACRQQFLKEDMSKFPVLFYGRIQSVLVLSTAKHQIEVGEPICYTLH